MRERWKKRREKILTSLFTLKVEKWEEKNNIISEMTIMPLTTLTFFYNLSDHFLDESNNLQILDPIQNLQATFS